MLARLGSVCVTLVPVEKRDELRYSGKQQGPPWRALDMARIRVSPEFRERFELRIERMWPFPRESALERELLEQYTAMIEACGIPGAKRIARQLLSLAKQQARSDPDLPPNFGQILLEREVADDSTRKILAPKRTEGVTDADIKWWWGLDKLERRLLIVVNDWFRMAAYKKDRAEGMSEEQASSQLGKSFPIFGNPEDTKNFKGDDRPLPFELKERINRWAEGCYQDESPGTSGRLRSHSSMNALIRSEIRAGRL